MAIPAPPARLGGPDSARRPDQHRRHHRSQYPPLGCRFGQSAVDLHLRRRLDAHLQAGGQRPLRLFLQQQRTARHSAVGTRYVYQDTVNATSNDLAGNAVPALLFNTSGFANIPSNLATAYDAYKRKSLNADASYFVGHFGGTHTFKGGYFWQKQSNDVLTQLQRRRGEPVHRDQSYAPVTSTTACDAIIAAEPGATSVSRRLPGPVTATSWSAPASPTPARTTQTAQGALLPGCLAGGPRPHSEPGRPLRQGNAAALRSHPLPLR